MVLLQPEDGVSELGASIWSSGISLERVLDGDSKSGLRIEV